MPPEYYLHLGSVMYYKQPNSTALTDRLLLISHLRVSPGYLNVIDMISSKSVYLWLCIGFVFAACTREQAVVSPQDECITVASANNGRIVEGQYMVAYKEGAIDSSTSISSSNARMQAEALLSHHRIKSEAIKTYLSGRVKGFVARLTRQQVQELSRDQAVEAIEPDRIISLNACFTVVDVRRIAWGVQRIGYADGRGKTAWIIDSGIDFNHPDLDVEVSRSRSFISGKTADDDNGHGTHVAGVIGARNNQIGTLGVASGAKLISLKVLDSTGEGLLSDVVAAVAHVSGNGKAGDVVNMSLGEGASPLLDREITAAAAKGIYFAIAAGNDAKMASTQSPARVNHANVFTVTAMDSTGSWAKFSNFGNDVVDYCAPGVRVLSTHLKGGYARMSGTSMAAPHLAGLLLLKGRNIITSGYVRNDPDGTPDPIAHY